MSDRMATPLDFVPLHYLNLEAKRLLAKIRAHRNWQEAVRQNPEVEAVISEQEVKVARALSWIDLHIGPSPSSFAGIGTVTEGIEASQNAVAAAYRALSQLDSLDDDTIGDTPSEILPS